MGDPQALISPVFCFPSNLITYTISDYSLKSSVGMSAFVCHCDYLPGTKFSFALACCVLHICEETFSLPLSLVYNVEWLPRYLARHE